MSKILVITLVFCMFLSVFSLEGCKKNKEEYDFTIWCYQTDSNIRNYGESPSFKELEKRSGKKVKFVLGDDYMNLISTKSYPEAVLLLGYPNGYETGINNGHVYDITDLVKNYAPNYRKLITSDDAIWRGASCANNTLGGFYVVNSPIEPPWRGVVMRKDLLEKYKAYFTTYSDWEDLGEKDSQGNPLLTPTLYEHWTDIFTVIKRAYVDSGGEEGVKYPLSIAATGFDGQDTFSAGFDVALGDTSYYDCGGSLKSGYVESGTKDYLTLMNTWFKAGFINPNFAQMQNGITPDNKDTVGTKKAKPLAMCWTDISAYLDMRINMGRNNGIEDYDLMAVPNPRISKDRINHLVCTNGTVGMSAFITTKCDELKAKEIVEWFDYLYTEEGSALMNYGVEGETYTLTASGEKDYISAFKENPDKAFYEYATKGFPTANDTLKGDCFKGPLSLSAETIWTYKNDGAYNLMSTVTFTGSKGAEYAKIMNSVTTYAKENIIKFIKGTRSLNEFDDYVATLKSDSYGIDKATAIREESYRIYIDHSIPEEWKNL